MQEVIRQRTWTKSEFRTAGFAYFDRKKEVVMARPLPVSEAPLQVTMDRERVSVPAGYIICYSPGSRIQNQLGDYEHWPCAREDFSLTYKPWKDLGWKPKPAERDLMSRGCRPYYKHVGVWAKRLEEPTYIQSKESPKPFLAPAGAWLVIGPQGDPYHIDDAGFRARYTRS